MYSNKFLLLHLINKMVNDLYQKHGVSIHNALIGPKVHVQPTFKLFHFQCYSFVAQWQGEMKICSTPKIIMLPSLPGNKLFACGIIKWHHQKLSVERQMERQTTDKVVPM